MLTESELQCVRQLVALMHREHLVVEAGWPPSILGIGQQIHAARDSAGADQERCARTARCSSGDLADAVFLAAVEGDRALLESLDQAIRRPVFPLCLGRRACPAEGRVTLGVVEAELVEALRGAEWLAADWYRRQVGQRVVLELLVDAPSTEAPGDRETVRDVPVSYSPERREYSWREVLRLDPELRNNPKGRQGMDFFAALGGS